MNLRKIKSAKERREYIEEELKISLDNSGKFSFDEKTASGKNCENLIGATQVPLGIAGPLMFRGQKSKVKYYIPLATTEGALVASVNRGCKAVSEAGGTAVGSNRIGITRGPVFFTDSIENGEKFTRWLRKRFIELKRVSEETSTHLTLKRYEAQSIGQNTYIRFHFDTQDAMGMNMATIATRAIADFIENETGTKCLSTAGNFDSDKKPAWANFLNGRGFKVRAEATLSQNIVKKILKTTPQEVYDVWLAKCMTGSAVSGGVGFNAQYANIVAAMYIATGQDPAHIVEGSTGLTSTRVLSNGDLYISVYLPALLVGTVGGGTELSTQREALRILGVAGGNNGKNSQKLAEAVAGAVLAGELSLLASLAEGSLARAHESLGR